MHNEISKRIEKSADGKIRVIRTVEVAEEFPREQLDAQIRAERRNLEMYQAKVKETEAKIAHLTQLLADDLGIVPGGSGV